MPEVLRKYVMIPIVVILVVSLGKPAFVYAQEDSALDLLLSPSMVLMEPSTGQVIYERNADERRSPASITKIMTLLVIFDQLEKKTISLEEEVVTSAYAKSMGGSQVFLEEGEIQTVDTLLKCIAVASGNDACVAMAEKIAGSEAEFVKMMNERAASMGLENTHFCDCSGLSDLEEHYTSARDVAIMSKELITKYPQIYQYSTIWMEDITHVTRKGSEVFTLSSTNKLLKQYPYATGLKTGSTDKAKYCLSATAHNNGMDLIAVVMGAKDPAARFKEAKTLLEYGFAKCSLYRDESPLRIKSVTVTGAIQKTAAIEKKEHFTYLNTTGADVTKVVSRVMLPETVEAPVIKGMQAGEIGYYLNDEEIGSVPVYFAEDVEKATFGDYFVVTWRAFLL